MTRYTSIGYKRKYLEAGFGDDADDVDAAPQDESFAAEEGTTASVPQDLGSVDPPKKKRKRSKKPKVAKLNVEEVQGTEGVEAQGKERAQEQTGESAQGTAEVREKKKAGQGKKQKRLDAKARSDQRRQRRIDERYANTTCLACREKGHMAKKCPKAKTEDGNGQQGKSAVGICYRCGSRGHNLSKCKKAVDPENPLPFAACFVCSGTGHLASACPQNKEKGVYPNGGNCKLCGETSHLAKNCPLRQNGTNDGAKNTSASLIGTGQQAGADEDDFHIIKRRTAEIDLEEKQAERAKRLANVKAGVHSGVVKAFGKTAPAQKKVVFF
ncbi:hypothetical protein OE88DRAFT_1260670 [Heliocybe sulcata]|uniref:CCHC-type domain-containing protein n=1 Tax=Heliocybe sulcata TaxID=5364 RepID=A0A5C3N9P5_9AGAM|nr:hypothetical protein OE88DRAFT_1260670 [Heliocybe sulcata]